MACFFRCRLAITIVLLALLCAGCCPDTVYDIHKNSEEPASSSSVNLSLEKRKLEGRVDIPKNFKVLDVHIVPLDNRLNALDTIDVDVSTSTHEFGLGERTYPYSGIRVDYWCVYGDSSFSKTLTFSQYFDISHDDFLDLNLFGAMQSERIRSLSKKDGDELFWIKEEVLPEAKSYLEEAPNMSAEMLPLLYCSYEKTDANFGACFEKLAKGLGENKLWSQSVSAAKAVDDFMEYIYLDEKSIEIPVNSFAADFIEKEYGLLEPLFQGDTVTIKNDSSKFNGQKLVGDTLPKISNRLVWRLQHEREDVLGPCYSKLDTTVLYNDSAFICQDKMSEWTVATGVYTIGLIYDCLEGETKIRSLQDERKYLCKNQEWSEYGTRISGYETSEYDSRIAKTAGDCTPVREGEYVYTGTLFANCKDGYWVEEDGKKFGGQECNEKTKGATIKWVSSSEPATDTAYFFCNGKSFRDTIPPVFYGDLCSKSRRYSVSVYNGQYYICDGSWRPLSEDELIPPILNRDTCSSTAIYKKYDESYYKCENNHWTFVEDSLVNAPYKEGFLCEESIKNRIYKYGDEYFICYLDIFSNLPQWNKAKKEEIYLYNHQIAHSGECANGLTGTSIYLTTYDKDDEYYVLCEDGEWNLKRAKTLNYVLAAFFTPSKMAGGTFIDSSTYQKKIGDVEYIFKLYEDVFFLEKIKEDGKTYDVRASKEMMFLSTERPRTSSTLENFAQRGEGFDEFYNGWYARAIEDNAETFNTENFSNTKSVTYQFEPQTIELLFADSSSYMDYESALSFCPAGSHIPDTTEILENYALQYYSWRPIEQNFIKTTYSFSWDGTKTRERFYNISWSSDAKDDDTQYCVETLLYYANYSWQQKNRIVECPKKTYPMIQALCARGYSK